jgi:hypothetical protein
MIIMPKGYCHQGKWLLVYSEYEKRLRRAETVPRSLKVSNDGTTHCAKFFFGLYPLSRFFKETQRFGSWFYFHLQVKGGQKPNLLGPWSS